MSRIKSLLTARRKGSLDTKINWSLNALLMFLITLLCYGIWAIGRDFIFPDFSPFSYWNLTEGSIGRNVLIIGTPMMLYALFNGLMDLFNKSDDNGTLHAENMIFKSFVALTAGIFEELLHRGVLIWFGLVIVYLDNKYFMWVLAFILIILTLSAFSAHIVAGIIMLALSIGVWVYVGNIENPAYAINGLILDFYQWMSGNLIILYAIYAIAIVLALIETNRIIEQGKIAQPRGERNRLADVLILIALLIWAGYAVPKGVTALNNLPFLPIGADNWTFLLYVGAVIWTNTKFKKGHKYQGPLGMMHSHISGFYLIYIAFTFGLIYAIIIHFLYDLLVFGGEHVAHLIKNKTISISPTKYND